jgi:alpha-tubulin suppressor-like RCC1 family protein
MRTITRSMNVARFFILTYSYTSPTPVLIGKEQQRVTALSLGGFHTAVVTAKGELFTFGRGDSGQLGHNEYINLLSPRHIVSIQQKVTKVACGVDHTICCTGTCLFIIVAQDKK